ncbi:MAG TPA: zinc ribbon domain-containing protein [Candidatus Binatia bacterium]
MPIYEYHCRSCDKDFEELVRTAEEAVSCPSCAGSRVERLLSAFLPGDTRGAAGAGGGCACTPQTCGCR